MYKLPEINEVITSRKNPFLLKMASLKEKKYRDTYGVFLIEGEKLVSEAFEAGIIPEELLVAEGQLERLTPFLSALLADRGGHIPRITCFADGCFEKISTEKAPEGVIAVAKHLDFFGKCIKIDGRQVDLSVLPQEETALVLYDIRDPSNLGAIMRSALAFGIERILLAGSCVELHNPKTVRASMGAAFRLHYAYVEDFAAFADALRAQGRRLLAAELKEGSKPLQDIGVQREDVFVIGNEGHGIPRSVSAMCDASVYIPIAAASESLNASVAASILLWEQSKVMSFHG